MLNSLLKKLESFDEKLFHYYDVSNAYDVTIMDLPANTEIPIHTHDENVFNYLMEGRMELFFEDGSSQLYEKGDWMYISSSTPHSVKSYEDTIILELWEK